MGQAIAFDQVIIARTRFEIDGDAVNWTMLFVPDADVPVGDVCDDRLPAGARRSKR